MKKLLFLAIVVVLLLGATTSVVLADKPTQVNSKGEEIAWESAGSECTKIQSGVLKTSDGELLTTGFSQWGYNYQGHIFNGMYCDYHPIYRPGGPQHEWCQANYGDVSLVMKWNDEWLANTDCDDDGLLDRHMGYPSYIGSGAWTTNHMQGRDENGEWTYFVKIVAKPTAGFNCVDVGGEEIWGSFCVIQEVESGTGAYLLVTPAGFGAWQP